MISLFQVFWQQNFYALLTSPIHANAPPIHEIAGFQRGVFEAFILLRYCVAYVGSSLPTFQDNLSVLLSWSTLLLKMVSIGCPQMLINKHNLHCSTSQNSESLTHLILLYLITLRYGEKYKLSGSLFCNFILPLIDTTTHFSTMISKILTLHCFYKVTDHIWHPYVITDKI